MSLISTHSGKVVDVLNPRPKDIDIQDIAHALSLLCRFTGQCDEFYSVAQHSVVVMHLVPDALKLEALLHDAAEAYLGDLSSPVKSAMRERCVRSDFDNMGMVFDFAITKKFKLCIDRNVDAFIHNADMIALATERRDICTFPNNVAWPCLKGVKPMEDKLYPQAAWIAKSAFLEYFNELMEMRK